MELTKLSVRRGSEKQDIDFSALAAGGSYHVTLPWVYEAVWSLQSKDDVRITLEITQHGETRRYPIDYSLKEKQRMKTLLPRYLLDADAADAVLSGDAPWFCADDVTDFLKAVAKCEAIPKLRRARMLEAAGGENPHQLSFLADCKTHLQQSLCALSNAHFDRITVGHYRLLPQGEGFALADMHTGAIIPYREAEQALRYPAAVSFALAMSEMRYHQTMPVFPLVIKAERFFDRSEDAALRSYFYRLYKSGRQGVVAWAPRF